MMKKISVLICFLLLTAVLMPAKNIKDEIKITVEEKQVQELSPEGLNYVFYVNIFNSSDKTYNLSSYNYRFVVNQVEYLRLQNSLDGGLTIPSEGSTMIAVPVKITYALLFENVPGIEDLKSVPCFLMGELVFSEGRKEKGSIPVAFSGEFPIFKEPEINPEKVDLKTLTVGGAEVEVAMNIRNPNGFELKVERIRYEIAFGGHPVGEGVLYEEARIENRAEKVYSIPLLLNFFEVGKDVHGLLQGESLPCSISGEIEINTEWGFLSLPFTLQKNIPIEK
jgi:LEA14-like dessication related protein